MTCSIKSGTPTTLIARRQKWHLKEEVLQENDIVYFKLKMSEISTMWLIGKVEFLTMSKDNKVRDVGISYRYDTEDGKREMSIVERPDERKIVPESEIDQMSDIKIDKLPKKTEIEESKPTKIVVNNPKKSSKRKTKTEIEKLNLEWFEPATED